MAIPLPVLCEFVWVLARAYRYGGGQIADAVRRLAAAGKVASPRPAIEAGLSVLEAGGDFADGAIAFEGAQMGGETFVSFDAQAVRLLQALGRDARLAGSRRGLSRPSRSR